MKNVIKHGLIWSVMLMLLSGFQILDEKSEKILNESKAKMEALKDFSANLKYEIKNKSTRLAPVARTGKVKYKKGNKYVLSMADQEIYCDGETLWLYLPEDKEVTILNYDPSEEGMSLESILGVYQASASSRYEGTEVVHGKKCHKIYLAVKDQSLEYNQANVWINVSSKMLEKVSLIDRKQTVTTYEFSSISTNRGLSDKDFQFDINKHSDVDVYDEREG